VELREHQELSVYSPGNAINEANRREWVWSKWNGVCKPHGAPCRGMRELQVIGAGGSPGGCLQVEGGDGGNRR